MKFRQIGHTTSQSFFPKTIIAWNRLAFAEALSLAVFRSNLLEISVHPYRIIPYILGYKSHFFYLNIGSKIECVLYVGNTKMYKNFTVKNHCLH